MFKIARCALLVPLFLSVVRADHHQETTKEDFQAFCQAWKGRWVGDVTFVADWPGLGKRGDKVTAYLQVTVAEDGNALMMKFFGGQGSGTKMFGYDARTKRIRSLLLVSGGFFGQSVVYKKDGKWIEAGEGCLPDGTKTEGHTVYNYEDDGKKLVLTGGGTVGDKKQDPQHDVWRRVSAK